MNTAIFHFIYWWLTIRLPINFKAISIKAIHIYIHKFAKQTFDFFKVKAVRRSPPKESLLRNWNGLWDGNNSSLDVLARWFMERRTLLRQLYFIWSPSGTGGSPLTSVQSGWKRLSWNKIYFVEGQSWTLINSYTLVC